MTSTMMSTKNPKGIFDDFEGETVSEYVLDDNPSTELEFKGKFITAHADLILFSNTDDTINYADIAIYPIHETGVFFKISMDKILNCDFNCIKTQLDRDTIVELFYNNSQNNDNRLRDLICNNTNHGNKHDYTIYLYNRCGSKIEFRIDQCDYYSTDKSIYTTVMTIDDLENLFNEIKILYENYKKVAE